MYSESRDFLVNTLHSIAKNLHYFNKINVSNKSIVVVIIQDGIMKMQEDMVEFYSEQDYSNNGTFKLALRRHIINQQT